MTDSINHRGPDGDGQWIKAQKNIGLGYRRLKQLDKNRLSKCSQYERFDLIFNNNIYN